MSSASPVQAASPLKAARPVQAHELLLPEDGPVRRLVVLLHGYGGDGREMMALARRMARRMTTAAFFCPDGGETCPDGVSGRQWFSTPGFRPGWVAGDPAAMPPADAAGHALMGRNAAAVCPALDARIRGLLAALEVPAAATAFAGFSQGQMMSLAMMMARLATGQPAPAAVVGFSGTLLGALPELPEGGPRPPVMLVHGEADDVVPFASARWVQARLGAAGFRVELLARPGLDHRVDFAGLAAATAFLDDHLPQ